MSSKKNIIIFFITLILIVFIVLISKQSEHSEFEYNKSDRESPSESKPPTVNKVEAPKKNEVVQETLIPKSEVLKELNTKADLILLEYGSWSIGYSCENRGYEYFHYLTVPDGGSIERVSKFTHETKLPVECRQFKTSSYKLPKGSPISYDRGHGVHQNIWDHDKELMKESNMMSNIVPQASKLNRSGVWRKTEELTECHRDLGQVEVWGGVIWGDDTSNDHFIESHGVTTPDYLWKVIKFPDGEVNAWVMPNNNTPKSGVMNSYLVSPAEIEKVVNKTFNIDNAQKVEVDKYSVERPSGCSLK